jgi:hypothetical protein
VDRDGRRERRAGAGLHTAIARRLRRVVVDNFGTGKIERMDLHRVVGMDAIGKGGGTVVEGSAADRTLNREMDSVQAVRTRR